MQTAPTDEARSSQGRWGWALAGHVAFTLVILACAASVEWYTVPHSTLIYPLSVILLAQLVWSLATWKLATGSLFDPYTIFLIAAMLFNAGQAYLNVFQIDPQGILGGLFTDDIIFWSLLLTALGLAFFHLGALLSARPRVAKEAARDGPTASPTDHDLRIVGWTLLGLSLPFALIVSRDAVGVVLSSGYQALYQTQASIGIGAGPKLIADFIVPAALFLLAGSRESQTGRVVSMITVLAYGLTELFLGFRYYAAIPLIAYAWLWDRRIRPLPRSFLLGSAAFMLFVVFPIVHVTRNTPGADRLSVTFLIQSFTTINNPTLGILHEMGQSLDAAAYTLNLVPYVRQFDHGVSYLYALTTVAPNLFWKIHPADAHGSLSTWLVQTVDPWFARQGGGLGFSFIAEAYLNFGWVGGLLLLALFGFLYGRLVSWGLWSHDGVRVATIATACVFFTVFARGESAVIVRGLAWYTCIPWLMTLAVARLRIPRWQNERQEPVAPTSQLRAGEP